MPRACPRPARDHPRAVRAAVPVRRPGRGARGGTRSSGRSPRCRSARTSSSRCTSCSSSRPPPTTWASTPSSSSSCPSCTPPSTTCSAPGFNLEGNHFQIAVGVIAPFFRLFPTPATLLFFQALFAAVSVFPVATAAFSLTGRSTGRLIAFAYAFSWGLQQMIDFDFHEIALAVPLLRVLGLRARPPPSRGGDRVGTAAGVRGGEPGLHRGRDRRAAHGVGGVPPGAADHARAARGGARLPARRAVGRAVPRGVGPVLVDVRDHRDHPALQPAP